MLLKDPPRHSHLAYRVAHGIRSEATWALCRCSIAIVSIRFVGARYLRREQKIIEEATHVSRANFIAPQPFRPIEPLHQRGNSGLPI